MFCVGDIIYTKKQYVGCSYYYDFAIVEKITPTGRFRIRPIEKESGERIEMRLPSGAIFAIQQTVKPLPNLKYGYFYLLNKKGERRGKDTPTWGCYYEKYNDELDLKDYIDCGD